MNLLGLLAYQIGRHDDAGALLVRSIQINPNAGDYHNNLGLVLVAKRMIPQAIGEYRRALELQPQYPEALFNLGYALCLQGAWEQAVGAFNHSLAIRPDDGETRLALARALTHLRRLDEAVAEARRAAELLPRSSEARVTLGMILHGTGDVDGAISAYLQALAIEPNRVDALNHLGISFRATGRHQQAMECFRRAIGVNPTNACVDSNRVYEMHFMTEYDAHPLLKEHQLWNLRHAERLGEIIMPHGNGRDENRPLRIGYVSPDFREHVVGWNLFPLLRDHDRNAVEIFCYSSTAVPDGLTLRLKSLANCWREIGQLSDSQAADLIRADQIDILVDLSLHSAGNRLLVFARKPAPVQVSYLGYSSTTGVRAIDYRFSDPYLDPPGSDVSCYSEQTVRLPRTYWCYQPGGGAPAVSASPAAANGYVTFGCLNNFAKASAPAIDTWALLLKEVPRSRLVLHCPPGGHRAEVMQRFARAGIGPNRVELVGYQPWPQYMETYNRIDIALDSFPFNGGITTCDAIWMGVPVVTLSCATAVGRAGRSIVMNVGLPDLIAGSVADYLRIATTVAGDLPALAKSRGRLREYLLSSPLMDARQFARDVEGAYRCMWQQWCRKR
jgi:predicted O-linked N-acetylglucosamine transferase (SPINDLY family)